MEARLVQKTMDARSRAGVLFESLFETLDSSLVLRRPDVSGVVVGMFLEILAGDDRLVKDGVVVIGSLEEIGRLHAKRSRQLSEADNSAKITSWPSFTHSVHDLLAVAPAEGVHGLCVRVLLPSCLWETGEAFGETEESFPQSRVLCRKVLDDYDPQAVLRGAEAALDGGSKLNPVTARFSFKARE